MPLPSDPVGRAFVQMILRDQYERWLVSEITSLIGAGLREITDVMLTKYKTISPAELGRRALLFKDIGKVLVKTYGNGADFMFGQMRTYAQLEANATIAQFRNLVADSDVADVVLQNLTRAEVKAIAEFPIAGLNIGEWFEKQASDMNAKVRGQIQLGLLQGETNPQIARRIYVPNPTAAAPSLVPYSNRATLALVRTTTTTVQTEAAFQGIKEIGDELAEWFRIVAVRDAHTTPICRALDGQRFRVKDPRAKRPPFHVNCRTTIVAEVNYKALGINPPNTVAGGFTMGSYAEWLRGQSESSQNDILGRAGANLFRSGKATLADLVSSDGRRLTAKALAARYGK